MTRVENRNSEEKRKKREKKQRKKKRGRAESHGVNVGRRRLFLLFLLVLLGLSPFEMKTIPVVISFPDIRPTNHFQ